jgi:hypothetical protein
MITGGCQCGAIRYQCTAEPLALFVCHCRECQKQSGSAFGMSLQVPRQALTVIRGQPRFWSRPADSGRRLKCAFCDNCGTRVWHEPEVPTGTATIKAGSLDEPVDFSTATHIWTASKLPGLELPGLACQLAGEPE